MSFNKNNKYSTGWQIYPIYSISLHNKDQALLNMIKNYFGGVGFISKHGEKSVYYRVSSIKDLTSVIIPHFDKYPLLTQKCADYILFIEAVEIIVCKEHLMPSGFDRVLAIWGEHQRIRVYLKIKKIITKMLFLS